MCLEREFCWEICKNVILFVKIGNFFRFSNFFDIDRLVISKYTSLSKFRSKILIFMKVMPFSVFTDLRGHWPGIRKIAVGTLQKNVRTKAARAFTFCHFKPYVMYLKVTNYWGCRKISICVNWNAKGIAKLHHHPTAPVIITNHTFSKSIRLKTAFSLSFVSIWNINTVVSQSLFTTLKEKNGGNDDSCRGRSYLHNDKNLGSLP